MSLLPHSFISPFANSLLNTYTESTPLISSTSPLVKGSLYAIMASVSNAAFDKFVVLLSVTNFS